MQAAYEPTAILASPHPAPTPQTQGAAARALLVAAGAMAMLAAGFLVLPLLLQGSPAVVLQASLGCVAAGLLSWRLSAAVHQWQARRAGQVDIATGLFNRAGLVHEGNALLARCQRHEKRLALVVIEFPDLLEVNRLYGREAGLRAVQQVVARMKRIAGRGGLAARTDRTQFTVLLPNCGRQQAHAAIQKVLGFPCRVELDGLDGDVVLVPDMGGETADLSTRGIDELYREVAGSLAQQLAEEVARVAWLEKEAKRHSKPMGLRAADGS